MCGGLITAAKSATAPTTNPSHPPSCVPDDPLSRKAYNQASTHLDPAVLNHSLRVWIYAKQLGETSSINLDPHRYPLLFTACIMHDTGIVPAYAHVDSPSEQQRFEIEGADAAVDLLRSSSGDGDSLAPADIDEVWRAIALHTTPQISERMGGMVRLVRLAVLADFGGTAIEGHMKEEIENQFPRGQVEKILSSAIVQQALDSPSPLQRAPAASWPNNLYRAYVESQEWDEVNKRF